MARARRCFHITLQSWSGCQSKILAALFPKAAKFAKKEIRSHLQHVEIERGHQTLYVFVTHQ